MSDSRNALRTWQEFSKKEKRPLTSRYLFTLARPDLQPNESLHPGTAWDKSFIEIKFNDIEEWDDFTEANANNAFCKVLDQSIPQGSHLNAPFTAIDRQTTIEDEEDIDKYFLQAIGPILSHSIECTRELLQNTSGNDMASKLRIPFKTEAVKVRLPGDDNNSRRLKRPNFPIYLPAKSMPGMKPPTDVIFVIGESARTVVWDPPASKSPTTFARHGFVHLGKVAMYCKAADTCFAFTMTTTGATVFRFFTLDNGDSTERWGVQLATFPWCPQWHPLPAENEMSAAKAIWCCIMMSLDPEARRIQRKDNLRPLSSWLRF